jgi:O-methyltransferase involved in polyketide biosynthesis
MAGDHQKIGPTAHYTAYVWSRLGLPYAELFATPRGAAMFWGFRFAGEWIAAVTPGVPSMMQYLAQRHLAIEHTLDTFDPDRIIELGAGLSRRGLTWARDRSVDYVEVDLPYMVEAKRAMIPERLRTPRLQHVGHNVLADGFRQQLRALVGDARRPAIIAEGVLGYFHARDRAQIASDIQAALADAGGIFLADIRHRRAGIPIGVRFLRAGIKLVTAGRGASEDFHDESDVRAFFAQAGFSAAEPIDLSTVPNAPRVSSPARVWRARAGVRSTE